MDPICKLLLCPSALYLLCHWLLSKVEILQLLKNNEWFGEIGTLPAISADCARKYSVISAMAALIIIMSFVFPSSPPLVSVSTECNCEPRKKKQMHKWGF